MSPILDPTYWPRWSVSFPSEQKSRQAIPSCLWRTGYFTASPGVLKSNLLKIAPQLLHQCPQLKGQEKL